MKDIESKAAQQENFYHYEQMNEGEEEAKEDEEDAQK